MMKRVIGATAIVASMMTAISVTNAYDLKKDVCAKGSMRRCLADIHTGDSLKDMMINQKKGDEAHMKEEFYTYVKEQMVDEMWKFHEATSHVIHAKIQDYYFEQGHHIADNYIRDFLKSPEIKVIIDTNKQMFQTWLEAKVSRVQEHFAEQTIIKFKQGSDKQGLHMTHNGPHSVTSIAISEIDRMLDEIYFENQDDIIQHFQTVIEEVTQLLQRVHMEIQEDGEVIFQK